METTAQHPPSNRGALAPSSALATIGYWTYRERLARENPDHVLQ